MKIKYTFYRILFFILRQPIVKNITTDKWYLSVMYFLIMGKRLNIKNPSTFNEKIQWLKLNGFKPEYTRMVDKYGARKYIEEKIGEKYLVPLIGGPWDKFEDIDFESLPDKFVLK